MNAVRYDDGQVASIVAVGRDITEHKQVALAQEMFQTQFQHAARMAVAGQIAGWAANSLNNYLGVVLGYARLWIDQLAPDHELYADLEQLEMAAEISSQGVRELLSLCCKADTAFTAEVFNLNRMVEQNLFLLRVQVGCNRLDSRLADDLWPVKMRISHCSQLLTNLYLTTAEIIAKGGRVIVETKNSVLNPTHCVEHPTLAPGEFVLLSIIIEDGCGMDSAALAKLAEVFFITGKDGASGTLGLALVYHLVRQNNGFIDAYSEPGHGTTIDIYLPRCG